MLALLPPNLPQVERIADPGVAYSAFAIAKHIPSAPNRVYSPLSAWTALRMLAPGTAGETRTELMSVLARPNAPELFRTAQEKSVVPFFAALSADPSLRLANAIWTAPGISLKSTYADEVSRTFKAQATEVQGDPVPIVNAWAAEKTEGRVKRILDRVDPNWGAILANALLFKGTWNGPFDPNRTKPLPFRAATGTLPVPTMHRDAQMLYGEYAGQPLVSLPLKGDFALFAILPPEGKDPWQWLIGEGEKGFRSGVNGLVPAKVQLSLPKFSTTDRIELIPPLQASGVQRLFAGADFSPMLSSGQLGGVSQIVQQTTMMIDEAGAEASAVTAIVVTRSAPRNPPKEPVILKFDRPFAYLLVHLPTRAPLMMGTYGGPGKG